MNLKQQIHVITPIGNENYGKLVKDASLAQLSVSGISNISDSSSVFKYNSVSTSSIKTGNSKLIQNINNLGGGGDASGLRFRGQFTLNDISSDFFVASNNPYDISYNLKSLLTKGSPQRFF